MQSTAKILEETAHILTTHGLHRGEQFAATDCDAVDICAAVYMAAEGTCPPEFAEDEGASRDLIESSERSMAAIRAISAAITNYEVPDSDGHPDLIEHVSQWTFTPPIGEKTPPTTSEVIGCILRAANTLATQTTTDHAA
ncbi:DUF6197 family protein [Streptomyces olivaceoviridis]|uniref:DUF6197 family protein n=1 Tax=Streptomyces olivaceoviridis TaxID=1921 RepID=UPI003698D968